VAQAERVVFSPEQLPDGTWITGNDVEFGEMRTFVDACLRPATGGTLKKFAVSDPQIVLGVIELMRASIVGPEERKKFAEARVQLVSVQQNNDSLTQEEAATQKQIYDLARELWSVSENKRPALRERMKVLELRGKEIRGEMKDLGPHIAKAKANLQEFFREEVPRGREHIVERLLREYKAWRRGALAVSFELPVKRVHWHILKPAGNSWQELVRYYESLSRNTGRRFDLDRLRAIHEFKPDEIFVGSASFEGYVVFVFNSLNMAVLDCPEVGNALYIMEARKWKFLSQMSKTELRHFHREDIRRVLHYSYWLSDLTYYLRQSSPK